MNKRNVINSVLAASVILSPLASAAGNPFGAQPLHGGYQLAAADSKAADGKCGEAKCGAAAKTAPMADKHAEASCGASKNSDGKCGADKKKDASCGGDKK